MLGFLRELATNPEEMARLFTHIGESRLPEKLYELYLDLERSPDLENLENPIETPVLLLHPESDHLLYKKRGREGYLDVFRRKVKNFKGEMVPGSHYFAKDGFSILDKYADMMAQFFLDNMDNGETTKPVVEEPAALPAVQLKVSA